MNILEEMLQNYSKNKIWTTYSSFGSRPFGNSPIIYTLCILLRFLWNLVHHQCHCIVRTTWFYDMVTGMIPINVTVPTSCCLILHALCTPPWILSKIILMSLHNREYFHPRNTLIRVLHHKIPFLRRKKFTASYYLRPCFIPQWRNEVLKARRL